MKSQLSLNKKLVNTLLSNLEIEVCNIDLYTYEVSRESTILNCFVNFIEPIDTDLAIEVLEEYAKLYNNDYAKELAKGVKVRWGY